MDNVQGFLKSEVTAFVYGPADILINMLLAFILGLFISYIYKITHKGLSYSQSFMLTIVFVALIVSMVMMVIGNNLARAFALVGALTIIRFRTVIKDTKDTPNYSKVMNEFSKSANLLHIEPSGDNKTTRLTFDILMHKKKDPKEFTKRIAEFEGISEITMVASKHDVDY